MSEVEISYSLGDAIDWKLKGVSVDSIIRPFSYSLGDAIDWKLGYSHSEDTSRAESPTR